MAKLPVGTLIPIGAVGTAKAEHVLSPNTFSNDDGVDLKGTMINQGTLTKTLTNQGDIVNIAKGYYTGGTVKANITNLIGSNIKKGIRVGNVLGTFKGETSKIKVLKGSDLPTQHVYVSDGSKLGTFKFDFGGTVIAVVNEIRFGNASQPMAKIIDGVVEQESTFRFDNYDKSWVRFTFNKDEYTISAGASGSGYYGFHGGTLIAVLLD